MMLILEVVAGAYAVGFLAMLTGMMNAPEGFEDSEGFHISWQNNEPHLRDVACVWLPVAAAQ